MKLNRCLSEQSQGPMVIVSGNDTAASIFTGNLPSRLILQTSFKIQKVILGTFYLKIPCWDPSLRCRGGKYHLLFVESGHTRVNIEGPKVGQLVSLCLRVLINNPPDSCRVNAVTWRAHTGQNADNRKINGKKRFTPLITTGFLT